MEVLLPHSLDEALAIKAAHPEAVPLNGGTDLMVDVNFGRLRPPAIVDLSRVGELAVWGEENGHVFLGSGVTYATIVREMQAYKPLVQASRSVGSPQIRNRGTVGGNLGTASPAGDALPVLAAYDAEVVLKSRARGERSLPWNRFLTGPKKTAIALDELIIGARWRRLQGPGSFSKIGTRNAMVIAVAGLCLVIDEERRRVNVALGSVGPTILRARQAEERVAAALTTSGTWDDRSAPLSDQLVDEFAELVASAAQPLDDVRGTPPTVGTAAACSRGEPLDGRSATETAHVVVRTRVNGDWREAEVWPGTSLLVFLREALGLYGSKNACEQGECGSCSVWLDGTLACSCLVLAAQAHERDVRTVESLTNGDRLDPIQEAFLEAGAVQCGFCTPGFVVAVTDLLRKDPNPSPATVREALSGNLCRCTGYQKIVDAVNLAASRLRARP